MLNFKENMGESGPNHVAIIMDGNGRYAKRLGLPRVKGHEVGMENIRLITKKANELNIKYLTLYAFSTENWSRPKTEVTFIMRLPGLFLNRFLPELIDENVKIETIGNFEALPKHTKKAVNHAVDKTKNNTGMTLIFALNYGARDEIVHAVQKIANEVQTNQFSIDDINSDLFESYLYTKEYPDPELLIRTSGECRMSNFLLWQISYSELFFTNTSWPELSTEEFESIIKDFQQRDRRFGGLTEEESHEN